MVVPAYNEEQFVTEVIETIPEFVDRIFVVDDCSTDGTWSEIMSTVDAMTTLTASSEQQTPIADGSGPTRPPFEHSIIPVRHERNRGRGAAVKTGYRMALRDNVDVVAVMDADAQMDPDNLERIVAPIVDGDADYAKGNRLVDSSHIEQMSRFRLFGNLLLTGLTRIATGLWDLYDPQNGYTAISRGALESLSLSDLYDRYGFLNDLLIRLAVRDMCIAEVPMQALYGDESSGIQYYSFVPKLSVLLLRGFCWRLWMTYVREIVPGR